MAEKMVLTRTLKVHFRRKETPDKLEVQSVRDLEQIGDLAEKFDSGEYLPHVPHFTFDRQLWAFLAHHAGLIMRVKEDAGFIRAIQSMADEEESLGTEKPKEEVPTGG